MKYLSFLLLLFYCTQLNAQTLPLSLEDKKMDAYLAARDPATLTIQVKNLPDTLSKVEIKYTLVQLGSTFQVERFAETDNTGKAKIILDQNLPYQQIWLSVGDYLYAGIYVNAGLTISLDVNKLPKDGAYMIDKGINYSGQDGTLNTVLNKNVLFRKKEREALYDRLRSLSQSRKTSSQDVFFNKLDSVKKELMKLDNEFIAGFKDYAWAVHNETLSKVYGNFCVAYWGDRMPDSIFNEIKHHQPIFTSNNGVLFYSYLSTYTQLTGKVKGLDQNLRVLDSLYAPQKSDILKLMLLKTEKDVFSKSYGKIINSIKIRWGKKIANDELTKANLNQKRIDELFASSTKIENATIGAPIFKMTFDAELYEVGEVKNADDFILSLKQKFPNKALILDFWATWCAPCLSDLPRSKALHEINKDLPVEYIYLCTSSGSSLDLWKNKVADLQIPGTHVFMSEKNIAKLKNMLNASGGYPAYVAIEANGKVNSTAITRMENLNREGLKASIGL